MSQGWNSQGGVLLGTVVISAVVTGVTATTVGSVRNTGIDSQLILLVSFVSATLVGMFFRPLTVVRPRRVTTVLASTWQRVAIVCLSLAAIGYVGLLEVLTPFLVGVIGLSLGFGLSIWFYVVSRRRGGSRTLVVGDNPSLIASAASSVPDEPIGVVSPSLIFWDNQEMDAGGAVNTSTSGESEQLMTDGGGVTGGRQLINGIERISGLSRLGSVLQREQVDLVALAFSNSDREEFFGVLQTCHDHGVDVVVHESLSDHVLAGDEYGTSMVRVDLEPIPWYSRIAKRAFDIAFAVVGLFVLAPLIVMIAIAITVDSRGPILYGQTRTSELGGAFSVLKFRSMEPESEDANPGDDADQTTRVGRVLRKTHMDEIPQLWSILVGDMSVVGPRAAWTKEEYLLEQEVVGWSKRWSVRPGLTGLAQIRQFDSTNGTQKLECDLEYIQRQSFAFDLKIVITQLLMVISDVWGMVRYPSDER